METLVRELAELLVWFGLPAKPVVDQFETNVLLRHYRIEPPEPVTITVGAISDLMNENGFQARIRVLPWFPGYRDRVILIFEDISRCPSGVASIVVEDTEGFLLDE